jgi:hypothetical protein
VDGSTPTTASTVYSTPITITSTTTLHFFAVDLLGNVESPINIVSYVIDTVAPTVAATPAGGTYYSSQSVVLTASEPATIYYTTNGSEPTVGSQTYTGPITIFESKTLKFIAVDQVGNIGSVNTEIYTIKKTILNSTVKIVPREINLHSSGKDVMAKMKFREMEDEDEHERNHEHVGHNKIEYKAKDVDLSTIRLTLTNDPNCALCNVPGIVSSAKISKDKLDIKFNRAAVQAMIAVPDSQTKVKIYGFFKDGNRFEMFDTICAHDIGGDHGF